MQVSLNHGFDLQPISRAEKKDVKKWKSLPTQIPTLTITSPDGSREPEVYIIDTKFVSSMHKSLEFLARFERDQDKEPLPENLIDDLRRYDLTARRMNHLLFASSVFLLCSAAVLIVAGTVDALASEFFCSSLGCRITFITLLVGALCLAQFQTFYAFAVGGVITFCAGDVSTRKHLVAERAREYYEQLALFLIDARIQEEGDDGAASKIARRVNANLKDIRKGLISSFRDRKHNAKKWADMVLEPLVQTLDWIIPPRKWPKNAILRNEIETRTLYDRLHKSQARSDDV